MIEPTLKDLMEKVDSKYTLVAFAAKRARELLDGSEVTVEAKSTKEVTHALEEIAEGTVKYHRTKSGIR